MNTLPPQNIEAEMSVLGGITLDNDAITRALEIIRPEDFYREPHRKIFRAMIDLSGSGDPCDLITLTTILKKKGELEEVGGGAYLATLVDYVPTAANIAYYCRIVKETAVRRAALQSLMAAEALVMDEERPVSETLHQIAGGFLQIGEVGQNRKGPVQVKEALKQTLRSIEERSTGEGRAVGIPSGISALDSKIFGFQSGDFNVIAARPSMGKTALMLNIAVSASMTVSTSVSTAIFSLEMNKESLVCRLLSACGEIDSGHIRTGRMTDDDWRQLMNSAGRLNDAPIFIDDSPAISVLELRAKCLRLKADKDIGLVIIDYLQLMRGGERYESRQQEISEISRSLKALAKELDIPVIALSQLNRSLENRTDKRPMMSDLRESGAIEQDADLILFIYREAVYCEACKRDDGSCDKGHEDAAEIIIGKQRNGPVGTVRVRYDGRFTRFADRGN